MSNRVYIQPTIFQDTDLSGEVVSTSYGFRVFDDVCQYYNNNCNKPEGQMTPSEYFNMVWKIICEDDNQDAKDAIEFSFESRNGVYIGDSFYTCEELGLPHQDTGYIPETVIVPVAI